ncbi:hypothetical protein LshimejAT787_1601950 [Lyophyllum shimeji]|uniref:Uncharacterized protein n=1 Tax=Lyophyllum shimeji TaxID=47721 RepID=A0A9P3PWH4_LYOSH|nr:hypothetical protein LshimejAT787_1601950 [Lyophyllum shimeji]
MSYNEPACWVSGNADVAGIGVRAAAYIQACLAGFNLMYMFHRVVQERRRNAAQTAGAADAEQQPTGETAREEASRQRVDAPAPPDSAPRRPLSAQRAHFAEVEVAVRKFADENTDYLGMEKALERSILMVGVAVIVSAIVEASSPNGLTAYHTLTVLNVSQINNWAGYLLTFISHELRLSSVLTPRKQLPEAMQKFRTSIPLVLHSMAMSGFGIYFWRYSKYFSIFPAAPDGMQPPCQPVAYLWVFSPVEISSLAVRAASVVFYGTAAIPFFHLLLWVLVLLFMTIIALFTMLLLVLALIPMVALLFAIAYIVAVPVATLIVDPISNLTSYARKTSPVQESPSRRLFKQLWNAYRIFLALLARGFLRIQGERIWFLYPAGLLACGPLIYSIVATERTVHINEVYVADAENKWTYGQILALSSALVATYLYAHEFVTMVRKRRKPKGKLHT